MEIFIAQIQVAEGRWTNAFHDDQRWMILHQCTKAAFELKAGFRIYRFEENKLILERYIGMRYIKKTCRDCGDPTTLINFFKNTTTKDGFQFFCKICHYAKNRGYYKKKTKRGPKKKPVLEASIIPQIRSKTILVKDCS